ncbi:hypothetical protein DV736_g837, partial [Chaetothyriales sp. CBS 134916]
MSQPVAVDAAAVQAASSSLWDRASTWVSENKAVSYTIAGTVVVVTAAGVVYYLSDAKKSGSGAASAEKRKSKKERRKEKKEAEEAQKQASSVAKGDEAGPRSKAAVATVEAAEELPEITEANVDSFSAAERATYAGKLKAAGNKAYGSKDYNKAIDLYGQAILCKPDPVYYSNRAACYNALSDWDKVVEDTSAALAMDTEYIKALNRRAHAYEHLSLFSEALLDYTASCIIDGFKNENSATSVERLLKKVAEKKGKAILATKKQRLPSATFVSNYLQSFRTRPPPAGLEPSAQLDPNTGKGQLQKGLVAVGRKTGDAYEEASTAFKKAVELGDLGEHEAFALTMRATFTYLEGDVALSMEDLNKAIELDPALSQAYIKRASMHLELGNREEAANDFERALEQNKEDPDIYYHRAQLHFILQEFADAAKDYHKSIELDKDFIYSHIQLGVTQYKMGSIASSMATFRRTIKNFDKVADVYNYYGELLLDQQKYDEAINRFETAIDMERQTKPAGAINVLPLINKALALFQWKQDFQAAEDLCNKALIIDPECDIAVATMAQLLLQQGKVIDALKYFERAAELSRTEGEIVNALSYAEATRTQLEVSEKYPQLASRLQQMGGVIVELEDVSAHASNYSHRSVTLSAPYWNALIGRSTSSTGGQQQSATNALFNSRVISRGHAKIRANPDTRIVTIEDIGSLHGTRFDGKRLSPGEPEPLYGGAMITLGTEVERIEHTSTITFKPVMVRVFYSWSDEEYVPPAPVTGPPLAWSRNSFTADYSDDEPATPYVSGDERDVYFVQHVPRTFTVPSSSDFSDDHISTISEDAHAEPDSPSSSPLGSPDLADRSIEEGRKRDVPKPANTTLPGDTAREAIQIDSDLDSCFHESSRSKGRQGPEKHENPPAAMDPSEQPQPKLSAQTAPSADTTLAGARDNSPSSTSAVNPIITRSPPFLQNILNNTNSESEGVTPRRSGCSWAGHNAVLYDPAPVSLDLAGRSVLSNTLSDLHPSTPANCRISPINTLFDDMIGVGRQPLPDSHVGVKASEAPLSTAASTFTLADTEVHHEIKPSRKRKLGDVAAQESFGNAQGQASAEGQQKDSMSVVEDTTTLEVAESVEPVLPSADVVLERPAKQQKTGHILESHRAQPIKKRSPFATFAAGALAGVAVGTISTFLGLAALPADYFA